MAQVKKLRKSLLHQKRDTKEGGGGVVLPTELNVPPGDLTSYCLMLYGEKGIGKTSLCSQFSDMTILMWEPRRRNLRVRQIPQPGEKRLNWIRFKQYVPLLVEQNTPVAIDTVDRCYKACLDYHCGLAGVTSPFGLKDFGELWHIIKADFEGTINELLYSNTFTVFVSHGRYRQVQTLTDEEECEMVIPTCPIAPWEYIKATADLVMYYGYVGRERAITIRGDQLVWASCGIEDRFLDEDRNGVITFKAGHTAAETYRNLEAAFNNKLTPNLILGKEGPEEEEKEEPKEKVRLPTSKKSPKKTLKKGTKKTSKKGAKTTKVKW